MTAKHLMVLATVATVALATAAGLSAATARAFDPGDHEDITTEAVGFLRPGVLEDATDEHAGFADDDGDLFEDDPEGANVGWIHADNCAFGETAQQINVLKQVAADELNPRGDFEPWSASDHFGLQFHPAQDIYSHSNWVELGFPVNAHPTTSDLVDFGTTFAKTAPDGSEPAGLGPWGTPAPLGTVRGDILMDDVVSTTAVNPEGPILKFKDATVEPIPSNWAIGLLPNPADPGQAGFVPGIDQTGGTGGIATFTPLPTYGPFSVPVLTSRADHRFFLSGVGARPAAEGNVYANQCDPYRRGADGAVIEPKQTNNCWPPFGRTPGGDFGRLPDYYSCIAYHGSRFALTHKELNKDTDDAVTRYPKARALAVLQSKYEWCRFLSQAGDAGSDGVALALWVKEGASPHPAGTPCARDDGSGPRGITFSINGVEVLNDKDNDADEPGEINLSAVLYDSPFAFHRSVKSKSGPVNVDDDGSSAPSRVPATKLPAPVSMCVSASDPTFSVALHGWDDDDPDGDNAGDFNQNGASPGSANVDDAVIGFSANKQSPPAIGAPSVRFATSNDLRIAYSVARVPDADGDGLDACGEPFYGTDAANPDSDADGLPDGIEVEGSNPTLPLVADSDGDGLKDGQEDANANGSLDAGETNPNNPDSDNDLLKDGVEVNGANPTDPLSADSDGDGLKDGREDANANGSLDAGETNPNDPDSDHDGLTDGQEVEFGTNPLDPDSDHDGLTDGRDVDWIAAAVRALPASAFKSPADGNRIASLNLLADAEARLRKGKAKAALEMLDTLRRRLDGCGTSPDGNDWIVDCATQVKIRRLVDLLRGNV